MHRCPHDCVTREYRRLPIKLHDLPQLLLLKRPVACCSCGAEFHRPMRRTRRNAGIVAGIGLCLLGGVAILVWKTNASSFSDVKDSMEQMLLRIRP